MFGHDFRDRLKAPGFEVEEFTAVEPYVSRHALIRGEKSFYAGAALIARHDTPR